MRAAYVRVPFQVELRDIPIPEIGPEEVLVKVLACGICGTDLHFGRTSAKEEALPLGHEFCGVVAKVGANVTRFAPGDEVIVENHTSLGTSTACKNGEIVYCTDLYISMNDPCMADYIKTHHLALHKNPGLTPVEATLAEPLTVALDVIEEGGIPIGSNVAIFGGGPIGLMALKLAKIKGARKVVLTQSSHSKARIALAHKLGADQVFCPDQVNIVEALRAECPEGFDRVFITAPPRTIPDAFEITRFGAIITYNGIDFDNGMISFDANAFHFKRLQLRATHSIPNLRYPIAIDLIKRKVIDVTDFVSHTFPLSEAGRALQIAETDKEHAIKVVVVLEDQRSRS
ncbi:MAG: alcohol dehydrogenase catalytic domain-containing protein [Candidatus Vecturithrix sp.]|jgi:L-iditol 2-dehydrogenase|nr:alcohol dehydrogenase catalytic domain-containing protein [Candidatus Vecturithrix sp.]